MSSQPVSVKPVVNMGDRILLEWATEDGEPSNYNGEIVGIKKKSKISKGSFYKYKILLEDGDEIETR